MTRSPVFSNKMRTKKLRWKKTNINSKHNKSIEIKKCLHLTSNAHNNLILLSCRHFFCSINVDNLIRNLVLHFKMLDFKCHCNNTLRVNSSKQILSCIENAKSTVMCFRVTPKTKIDFVKNRLCVKFPVFL